MAEIEALEEKNNVSNAKRLDRWQQVMDYRDSLEKENTIASAGPNQSENLGIRLAKVVSYTISTILKGRKDRDLETWEKTVMYLHKTQQVANNQRWQGGFALFSSIVSIGAAIAAAHFKKPEEGKKEFNWKEFASSIKTIAPELGRVVSNVLDGNNTLGQAAARIKYDEKGSLDTETSTENNLMARTLEAFAAAIKSLQT